MTVTDTTRTDAPPTTGPDGFDHHREHAQDIETALVRLLDEARAAGCNRIGMDVLWGRLRWDLHLSSADEDEYALNNNWRAYWARYLMIAYPRFDSMFVLRRSDDADEWQARYIARQHTTEYDLPEDGSLFALDVPAPRNSGWDL